jgi:hypothetical protein
MKGTKREYFCLQMEMFHLLKKSFSILNKAARKKMMIPECLPLESETDATKILSKNQQESEKESVS